MVAGDELVTALDAEGGSKKTREQQSSLGESACPQPGVSTASGFKSRRSVKGRSSSLKEN